MRKIFTFFLALAASVGTIFATEGALNGKFTVNADGDQIVFSKGNLQYKPSTETWRFAESQLTALGQVNTNISVSTYDGWLDLFGWGTGDNPTNYSTNWQDYPTYREWGNHPIENGGNAADLWYTLTKDEWDYIFCKRDNAASLFGLGSVDGVSGLIILPDNWTNPDGITFQPSTSNGLTLNNDYFRNTGGKNFEHNQLSSGQWQAMEEKGAVFLPAAGYRWDNEVTMTDTDLGNLGHYWAATPNDNWQGYELYFDAYELSPQNKNSRIHGLAVRLVQSAEINTAGFEHVNHQSSIINHKFIKSGQLFIQQGDKTYNAHGARAKNRYNN